MKALVFLLALGSVIAVLVWRVRKSQAEAAHARSVEKKRRQRKDSRALSQDTEIIWPVIIKPVSGRRRPGSEAAVEEPTMTSIEFEPSPARTAQQGGTR